MEYHTQTRIENLLKLPDEMWRLILEPFHQTEKLRLASVSMSFCRLAYESIMSLSPTIWNGSRTFAVPLNDEFINRFPNVNSLSLYPKTNCNVTNDCLKRLNKLTKLNISGSNSINDDGIKDLKTLTCLSLSNNFVISNQGISGLINLTELDLYSSESSFILDDDGIKHLTKLLRLSLSTTPSITFEGIKTLTNLTYLYLFRNSSMTDSGLKYLTKLTSLTLSQNSTLSDEGISSLINLQSLSLNMVSCVTDNGMKELYNLTSLSLEDIDTIGDISMKSLTKLTELAVTNICSKMTDHGLNYLKDSLKDFVLRDNTIITAGGIGVLTNLTNLYVCGTNTSNESFKTLTNLTCLDIPYETNGEIDINGIRGLTNLTKLCVNDSFKLDKLEEIFPNTVIRIIQTLS